MNVVASLVKRFLFSERKKTLFLWMAWIAVVGISLGLGTLFLARSVMNGFEKEIRKSVTHLYGDVILYTRGRPIDYMEKVKKIVHTQAPFAKQMTASFVTQALIVSAKGTSGIVLEGLEKGFEKVTPFQKELVSGRFWNQDQAEVVLGKALAEKLSVHTGDWIQIVFPFARAKASLVRSVRVVGIVEVGFYDYDIKMVWLPLKVIQQWFELNGKVTNLKVRIPGRFSAEEVSKKLQKHLGYPFHVRPWSAFHRNLRYAVVLERTVVTLILSVILLVAALNLVSTLVLMVYDKTRELSILKAMGLGPKKVFLLFFFLGTWIACVGILGGLCLGVGGNLFLQFFPPLKLPPQVYHLDHLPVYWGFREFSFLALGTFVISLLATLYPAYRASKRSPLEGIRFEN